MGIADDRFTRGTVPMTKAEIRAYILAKAAIGPGDSILDIGAGTGSITVEAALLAPQGKVVAVERNPEGLALIEENCRSFGVTNVTVIAGQAPAVLPAEGLFDAIIIGGSGGKLADLLAYAVNHLQAKGRLVIPAVTMETVQDALAWLDGRAGLQCETALLQTSRLVRAGNYHMYQANNPIHIIACYKGERETDD